MARAKKQYPLDFKTMFGVSTMGLIQGAATALLTSGLMLYITDYSGLYKGIAGKAAEVATLLLLIGRLVDAFLNPPCGILMDRSPRTRIGKFKPYLLGGTIVTALTLVLLFNIPSGFSDVQKIVFLCVVYLVYDIAWTLIPLIPMTVSLSDKVQERTTLLTVPRIVTTVFSIVYSFYFAISIALGKDGVTPNLGLGTLVIVAPLLLLSLVGIAMVKEGNRRDQAVESIRLRNIFRMYGSNKPLLISLLSSVFGGFIFTLISAAATYYIKYAFGAENFGAQSAIYGMCILFAIIAGTLIAPALLKKATPGFGAIVCYCVTIIPLAVLWLINLGGPIRNPFVLYPLLFLALVGSGMSYIPNSLISMECMDYNKFRMGRSMEGLVSTTGAFVANAQSAFSAAITGGILVAVGYNAALYEKASTIPSSLFSGLGLVFFLLPTLCGILATVILFLYPLLKKEKRDDVYRELESQKSVSEQ